MIILSVEEIIELHAKMVSRTGGSAGLRDIGLLESAVYSAQAAFGDEEVYPTAEEKAARLMYALVSDHAFIDGNKRIGVFAMLMTLKLNGIAISYSQKELADLGLSVAAGNSQYKDILMWIREHRI